MMMDTPSDREAPQEPFISGIRLPGESLPKIHPDYATDGLTEPLKDIDMDDDAHDRAQACGQSQAEMPRYQSHKKVWALKIKDIVQAPADYERVNAGGDWYIVPEENGYARIVVGHDDFILRHKPEIGGYYVVYEDGYKSYSPAKPFEDGYTRIN